MNLVTFSNKMCDYVFETGLSLSAPDGIGIFIEVYKYVFTIYSHMKHTYIRTYVQGHTYTYTCLYVFMYVD